MPPACARACSRRWSAWWRIPATGSANAALAALLTSLAPGDNLALAYDIAQGEEMGRPSRLLATARKTPEGPVLATVSGACVGMMQGRIDL